MQVHAFNDRSVEQVRELIFPHFGLTYACGIHLDHTGGTRLAAPSPG